MAHDELAESPNWREDARALELDLVSFSPDGSEHDWNDLLGKAGLLWQDQAIARLDRFAGVMVLVASLALAAWLLRRMARSSTPSAVRS